MLPHNRAYKSSREISRYSPILFFFAALAWRLALVLSCGAEDVKPGVAPPSKWVRPVLFDRRALLDAADASVDWRWLLKERQVNVANGESFVHETREILTQQGAESNSTLLIDYDPGCETLTFHWIRVLRGPNSLDRLDASKIQIGPASGEERFVFSSAKSAVVPVGEVRPGDIIDFSYSIEGSNPALGEKFACGVPLQFQEPVARLVTRVLWPPTRKLYVQNHSTGAQPVMSHRGDLVEFDWDLPEVPGLRLEGSIPAWYDPYPWVQLSEFQKWSDVNHWALALFGATNPPSAEFTRRVNEWKHLPSVEEEGLAALRFVQQEVDPAARESGDFGYEPAAPAIVLARQHGDSADKARLLSAMLRALQIEAWPVLVNLRWRQAVAEWHPSPTVFDYVLVEAKLDGQTYWLDPAAQYERGTLAARSWPNCGYGLVVRKGSESLTAIPPPPGPRTTVTERFRVGRLSDETTLRVETLAEGTDADELRQRLATTARGEIERADLSIYAKAYPDIRTAAPLAYSDEEDLNRIELTEYYSIPKMWTHLPDETLYHCQFYGATVEKELESAAAPFRSMPLAIDYPAQKVVRIEARLPAIIPVNPETKSVESPAFVFGRTVSTEGDRLVVQYEYRSLTDALAPEGVADYLRQSDAAANLLSYTVFSVFSN